MQRSAVLSLPKGLSKGGIRGGHAQRQTRIPFHSIRATVSAKFRRNPEDAPYSGEAVSSHDPCRQYLDANPLILCFLLQPPSGSTWVIAYALLQQPGAEVFLLQSDEAGGRELIQITAVFDAQVQLLPAAQLIPLPERWADWR
jgi:hypothetical protein